MTRIYGRQFLYHKLRVIKVYRRDMAKERERRDWANPSVMD